MGNSVRILWISVADVMRQCRLRSFGHLERMSADNWMSACRKVKVAGSWRHARGRKKWKECVVDDMRKLGLSTEKSAQDRAG